LPDPPERQPVRLRADRSGGFRPSQDGATQAADDKKFGFGGGLGAKPLGVIELSSEGTKFIPLGMKDKLLGAAAAGFLLGFLYGKWRSR
jgi:hypothetical protein